MQLVNTTWVPHGQPSFDVADTSSGNGFFQASLEEPFRPIYESSQLFLGRLLERNDVRILTKGGAGWYPKGFGVAVVDSEAPSWDAITSASARVQLRLWDLGPDGLTNRERAYGSVLVEMLPGERIRIERFDTHSTVSAFTSAATTYER